jgi:hypothetical protein
MDVYLLYRDLFDTRRQRHLRYAMAISFRYRYPDLVHMVYPPLALGRIQPGGMNNLIACPHQNVAEPQPEAHSARMIFLN